MSNVLYRKYRSQSFAEVIGQETVISILKESILQDSISHAYLFCGPRGTGKTSIARIFSRGVNCTNFIENQDVCNQCENCLAIMHEQTMDIIEMDAASNRGIEEIRNLKDSVNYLPTSLKKKVYIIDEAHMLTKEAFNALLKTLEEPPEHVIFILATTEAHKLPITILSRVERYDFRLATKKEITKKLELILKKEKKKANKDVWDVIYTKSGGSFRDAESLLGKLISNSNGEEISKEYIFNVLGIYSENDIDSLIESLKEKDFKKFHSSLEKLNNLNGNINTLIDQVLESLHKILIDEALKGGNPNEYSEIINIFIKTKKDIRDFSDKQMVFELNILNYFNRFNENNGSKNIIDTPNKADENLKKDDRGVELNEEKISHDNLLTKIATSSEIKLPRLKAILLNSEYQINERSLNIYNKYKFNIDFINKKENNLLILNAIKSFDLGVETVRAEMRDLKEEEEALEEENSDFKHKDDKKNNEGIVDNSDIIENIL